MRYFIILILFKMINLDNTNYVTIVETSSLCLLCWSNGETLVTYAIQMYIVKYVQKCVEKVYRKVKLIIIKLFAKYSLPTLIIVLLWQHC